MTFGRWVRTVAVAALVLLADQVTKWWAMNALLDGPVDVLGPLRLRLVFNTSSAFGLLPARLAPLVAIGAVVVVVVLLRASSTASGWLLPVATGLVLGGAVGNLTDRVARAGNGPLSGAVVDFIDLQFWPVFNLADMAVVVGALLLALLLGGGERSGSVDRSGGRA